MNYYFNVLKLAVLMILCNHVLCDRSFNITLGRFSAVLCKNAQARSGAELDQLRTAAQPTSAAPNFAKVPLLKLVRVQIP